MAEWNPSWLAAMSAAGPVNDEQCPNCERCTWNPGADCGIAEHPLCERCGHCGYRHAAEAVSNARRLDLSEETAAIEGFRPLPPHLRDDAPYLVCSKCGRHSWDTEDVEHICRMLQPDDTRCDGRFMPMEGE